jgi:hypothetical protein
MMNGKDKPIIRNLDKCELIDAIAKAKIMMNESETIEQMNASLNYAALASSSFPYPLSALSGFSANVQIIIHRS